jgi:hypothetical protein
MAQTRARPNISSLWAGLITGLFISTGLHPEKGQVEEINGMLNLIYSALPTDRVVIPIFWFKVLIWFLLVIIPLINTGIEVLVSGKSNIILFLVGIVSGYLVIFNSTITLLTFAAGIIVAKLYPILYRK